jgi:hypothetical protein
VKKKSGRKLRHQSVFGPDGWVHVTPGNDPGAAGDQQFVNPLRRATSAGLAARLPSIREGVDDGKAVGTDTVASAATPRAADGGGATASAAASVRVDVSASGVAPPSRTANRSERARWLTTLQTFQPMQAMRRRSSVLPGAGGGR